MYEENAVFGPYNLGESMAISTCYPTEIVFWKNKTHLEDAGCDSLSFGGVKNAGGRSHHFGGKISTITYRGAEMVLCSIDDVNGIYICSEETAPIFSRGFSKLIREKLNPNSEINKKLEAGWKELQDGIRASYGIDFTDVLEIQQKILNVDHNEILSDLKNKSNPRYVSEEMLFRNIEGFYPSDILGRSVHIGMAFHYFGLPTQYLIEPAIKEEITIWKTHQPDEDYSLLESYLRESPEERLFGKD